MKKKILFVFFGFMTIVCAVSLLNAGHATDPEDDNSGTFTEQNRPLQDKESLGEGVIWESLSRHFMTVN